MISVGSPPRTLKCPADTCFKTPLIAKETSPWGFGFTEHITCRFGCITDLCHAVRILVRNAERAAALKEQGAEVILGDLLDNPNLTEAIQGVDAVVHIAAQFRGGISEEVARAVNLDATIALANAALATDVTRFVFTSTSNVYRDLNVNRPCREEDILEPAKAIYPKTKIASGSASTKHFPKSDWLNDFSYFISF